MNAIIETLNRAGELALRFAWPMFWQSSLLIALLYALDLGLRRKLRPAVRYALWLLLLVKLVLPPSLALPTAPSWWLRRPATTEPPRNNVVVVSYGDAVPAVPVITSAPLEPLPAAQLSPAAIAVLVSALGSVVLLAWLVRRWREVTRTVRHAQPAPDWLLDLMEESRRAAGVRRAVPLRRLDRAVSPAVCGLVRPVVVVPGVLLDRLAPPQARAILLHELIHLRRGDVWVNCLQTLLQIIYWWHPLLWLANARIRGVREEAVDEAVMLALRGDAASYAPTLLEVARLALPRPLASLGLVGILESQRSLRRRIERLLDFCPPRKAGLTLGAAVCVLALGAFALPMGEGPAQPVPAPARPLSPSLWTARSSALEATPPNSTNLTLPTTETHEVVGPRVSVPAAPANLVEVNPGSRIVVEATKQPIQESAVISSGSNTNEVAPLYTRVIKVDPNAFTEGIHKALGLSPTNNGAVRPDALRRFFAALGVDLAPPKAVFFNDREGTLAARASMADLDRIELAVQAVNVEPPQIQIKARFMALPEELAAAFWSNPELVKLGGTNLTTILTPAQTAVSFKLFESADKAEMLSEMSVTTLSGRQTQVQSVELMTVVTNLDPRALAPPGPTTGSNSVSPPYLTTTVPLGPTLDVIPQAGSRGPTIQMTLIATLTEFLGYDQPSNSVTVYLNGRRQQATPPLPHFRVGTVTQTAVVQDGHTIVLGGIRTEKTSTLKSKVPVLGDVPVFGRLFRSEFRSSERRQLLVFVTPTLIDPAGNRIHSDEPAAPGGR